MFGLDSHEYSTPAVDMESMREWAGEIASSYLKAGMEPTHSLCKIAQVENLTPDQIKVLAAEANKAIHNTKYASVEEKYHAADFPLADASKAIQTLQLDGGETKIALELPPPKLPEIDPYKMFGVEPEVFDKTASVVHELKTAAVRADLLLQKHNDRVEIATHKKQASERTFIKTARSYLLEESGSSARMKMLGALDHLVKVAEQEGVGRRALAKLAALLGREGKLEPAHAKVAINYFLSKEADQKAPQELISENLQARVINGQHPLYITLKTVADNEADLLRFQQERDMVQDKVRILRQKIRAL